MEKIMGKQALQHTDQQLYGANGQPQMADVDQDKLYDCYLVSSMGALAGQQPDRIRDAIRYEPDPNSPNAGLFHVTLHHPARGPIEVPVTQAEVEDNIQKGGGGTADNRKGSPIWPSVMETAFAKLHDPNPQNNTLDDAYKVIGDPTRGGSLHEAMFALIGDAGHNLRYSHSPNGSSAPPGNNDERPPFDVPLKKENVSRFDDANGAYVKISEALGAGKAVTLSTRNADVNDGLMKHHAYIITDIEQREKKDGTNDVWITLRNPYAHNNNTPEENKDTSKPSITVSLGQR
jgi:Calpain family cysteine protease